MSAEIIPGVAGAFIAATLTGFLGSLHCIGMCGTAVASVLSRRPAAAATGLIMPIRLLKFSAPGSSDRSSAIDEAGALARGSLAFNAGRIASYIIAGTLVAGIAGSLAGQVVMRDVMPLRLLLFIVGQCLIIATGFYIAGYTRLLEPFERAGQVLWRSLQRWLTPLLRTNPTHGQGNLILIGALWGWIPCGMVYAVLATAMASGSAQNGALVMFGFGLGTLPAMFAAGMAAAPLLRLAQRPKIRIAAGAIVVALGLFGLLRSGSLANIAVLGEICSSAITSVFSGVTR